MDYLKKVLSYELNIDSKTKEKILSISDLEKFDQEFLKIIEKQYDERKILISKNKIIKILNNMLSYFSWINYSLFDKEKFEFKAEKKIFEDVFRITEGNERKYKKIYENNIQKMDVFDLFINKIDFSKKTIVTDKNENISFLFNIYQNLFFLRNNILRNNKLNMEKEVYVISTSIFYILVSSNIFSGNFYSMLNNEIKNIENLTSDENSFLSETLRKIKKLSNNYLKYTNELLNPELEKYKNKDEKKINQIIVNLFDLDKNNNINIRDYTYFLFKIITHSLSLNNFFFNLPILKFNEKEEIEWNCNDFNFNDEKINSSFNVDEVFEKLKKIYSGIKHNPIYLNDKQITNKENNNYSKFLELYKYIFSTLKEFLEILENISVEDWFLIKNSDDIEKFVLIGKEQLKENSEKRDILLDTISNNPYKLKGLHRSTIILLVKREIKNLYTMLTTEKEFIYFSEKIEVEKEKMLYTETSYGRRNKILNISSMIKDVLQKEKFISNDSKCELEDLDKKILKISKKKNFGEKSKIIIDFDVLFVLKEHHISFEETKEIQIKYSSTKKISSRKLLDSEINEIRRIIKIKQNPSQTRNQILNIIKIKNSEEKNNFSKYLDAFLKQKNLNIKDINDQFIDRNEIIKLKVNFEKNNSLFKLVSEKDKYQKSFMNFFEHVYKNNCEFTDKQIIEKIREISEKNKIENFDIEFWENKKLNFKERSIDENYDIFKTMMLNRKDFSSNAVRSFFYRDILKEVQFNVSSMKKFTLSFNSFYNSESILKHYLFKIQEMENLFNKYMNLKPIESKNNPSQNISKWIFKKNDSKIFNKFVKEFKRIIRENLCEISEIQEKYLKINSKIEKMNIPIEKFSDSKFMNRKEDFELIKEYAKNENKLIILDKVNNFLKSNNHNKEMKNYNLEVKNISNIKLRKKIFIEVPVYKKLVGINENWKKELEEKHLFNDFVDHKLKSIFISEKTRKKMNELSEIKNMEDFNKKFKFETENQNIKNLKKDLLNSIKNL